MKIIEKKDEDTILHIVVDSDEESLFNLLKGYLEQDPEVDVVGVYKEHHLLNKTEFFLRTKKQKASDLFKKTLTKVKKDLDSKKVK